MKTDIAIIANKGKSKVCDYRDILSLRYAQQDLMEIIDAAWIEARLTGARGEKAALARAMGVTPDVVTKILTGQRRVQPEEMTVILSHFGASEMQSYDPTMQKLLQRIPELTEQERGFLLAAAEGMIARRHAADE